jgi:hypothetical protein
MESRNHSLAVAHRMFQTVTAARLLSPFYAAACISQVASLSSSGESGYGGIDRESATHASPVSAGVA